MRHLKIVLIGAGSVSFSQGLLADIMVSDLADSWTVGLVDVSEDALDIVHKLAQRMLEAHPRPITLEASTNRRDVLPGADVVVTTIGVGGRRAWEADVFVPRQHGIFQPVGDSVMAGGISRSLRQVPPMVEIARDVLALAPGARFFNYGNPMTAICRAVRSETGAQVVGLCHGVIHSMRQIAHALGARLSEVNGLTLGVNHLTFHLNLRLRGQDAWPLLKQFGGSPLSEADREQLGRAFPEMGETSESAHSMRATDPFCWELFDLYDALPLVGDRHVTEFFPAFFRGGAYYGKQLGVDTYSMEATIESGDRGYERMARIARGEEDLDPGIFERVIGEHEQLLDLLASAINDEGRFFSANIPNNGVVSNVPDDAVLEMPCALDATGAHAVAIGEVPAWIADILAHRHWVTELTVEAALTGSTRAFAQALIADGMADSTPGAQRLADDLLKAQNAHLPQFA